MKSNNLFSLDVDRLDANDEYKNLISELKTIYPSPTLPEKLSSFDTNIVFQEKTISNIESAPKYRVVKALPQTTKGLSHFGKSFQKRLGVSLALVMVVCAVILGSFTVFPDLVRRADSALNGSCYDGKGNQLVSGKISTVTGAEPVTNINLSKTVNGITVMLNTATADPNVISLFVTITGPGCPDYLTNEVSLTDAQGQKYQQLSNTVGDTGTGANGGNLLFDASDIINNPTSLNLNLKIGSIVRYQYQGGMEKVQGPVDFSFSVPFNPHFVRTANLNQSITANGVTAELQKVIVSPAQTRIFIKGVGTRLTYEINIGSNIFITNVPGKKSIAPLGSGTTQITGTTDGTEIILNMPFYNEQSDWTIKIFSPVDVAGNPYPGGPWTFNFELPQPAVNKLDHLTLAY